MRMFHLWLMPPEDVSSRLAGLVTELSLRYGGPTFDPHLTLLGRIEGEESAIVDLTNRLAAALSSFEVQLKAPVGETQYFRCLYFPAEPVPPLLDAHQQAQRLFGRHSTSPFQPHVSILYGLFPERIKQEIIKSLPTDLPRTFLVSELRLIRADSTNPPDWHPIASPPL